jgi:hypothetical protein
MRKSPTFVFRLKATCSRPITQSATIPLVGLALEAMKRHPNGFPRYFDKGSNLSAALMKALQEA